MAQPQHNATLPDLANTLKARHHPIAPTSLKVLTPILHTVENKQNKQTTSITLLRHTVH